MAKKTVASKTADRIYVGAYVSKGVHSKIIELGAPRELKISDVVREAIRDYIAKHEQSN